MFRTPLLCLALPLLLLAGSSTFLAAPSPAAKARASTGTLEKFLVADGTLALHLDLNRLNGIEAAVGQAPPVTLRFRVAPRSFLTFIVFANELRAVEPGLMELIPQDASAALPPALRGSWRRLALERLPWGDAHEFALRDAASGLVFFDLEGSQDGYDARAHSFAMTAGRLVLAPEFAKLLGRPADAGAVVGTLETNTNLSLLESTQVVNGEARASVLPSLRGATPEVVLAPGPDVIVGDLPSLVQSGSSGTQVGLAVSTTSCNMGTQQLDWQRLPDADHPVIPQNLYRMSGGASNSDRFEQIGQSWLKHAFTALQQDACGFGCVDSGTGTRLGVGCSDPYSTSLNGGQTGLGSRAWVNPFTGAFPRGDSGTSPNDHTGHTHSGVAHRIVVNVSDLNTSLNAGATYYAEAQYVTPHEYAWCQTHAGECNMNNNASYRRFNVTGTTSFTFAPTATTVRMAPAILAWSGATTQKFEPAPGADGIGYIGYKVTGPSNGLYHYEYAVYNQNLDRAIQSFSIPLGCGVAPSAVDFHAPPVHPGFAADGTPGSAGYSSAPWTPTQTTGALRWKSETFAQNQNASALRWGNLYNFRFDSPRPPRSTQATISFFKMGAPLLVTVQGPTPDPAVVCHPPAVLNAFSRKAHGAAGDLALNLPLSGTPAVESRSGGAGGDHQLLVRFTNPVTIGSAAVTSQNNAGTAASSVSGDTVTLDLHAIANAQTIMLKLNDVNDGTDAGTVSLPMSVLLGDTNGDGLVNSGDAQQTRDRAGEAVGANNFPSDVNADGEINSGDSFVVRAQSGTALGAAVRERKR